MADPQKLIDLLDKAGYPRERAIKTLEEAIAHPSEFPKFKNPQFQYRFEEERLDFQKRVLALYKK